MNLGAAQHLPLARSSDPAPTPVTVGLVGCAAAKLARSAPARELYTSSLFRKASAYAEAHSDHWFVLSAEHGLVHPDEVLEPYDTRLGTRDGPPIWEWARRVADQVDRHVESLGRPVDLLVLAGEQYRTFLRLVDHPARVPMAGLGIGDQLGYLTRQLGDAHRRLAPATCPG